MKYDTHEPCASCPYRKDVPTSMWDKDEFRRLLANDATTRTNSLRLPGGAAGLDGVHRLWRVGE